MNHTSSLWRFGAISYGPLPDLVCSSSEEAPEIQHCPHGRNDLR